jgi:hypothetical protein
MPDEHHGNVLHSFVYGRWVIGLVFVLSQTGCSSSTQAFFRSPTSAAIDIGIEPDGPPTKETFADLPMPDKVWDDERPINGS